MNPKILLPAIFLLLTTGIFNAVADDFATVSPPALDLTLAQGDSTIEQVSITIHPLCIRPYDIDVVASDPQALVANLTGVLENVCGGDTSAFDISIMGTGSVQAFDLEFVDIEFGGVLASIPVTIVPPASAPCTLDLTLTLQRDRALNLDFELGTLVPADFNLFLSAYNQTISLLSGPVRLPVIKPPVSAASSIPDFPDFGTIGILATITTAEDGIRCSVWKTVDTSVAP